MFWATVLRPLLPPSLVAAGDWLQGPYVYALYQHYGFSRGDIGRLFIAGFGSSLLFGTLVGSLADKHGRKAAALTYCATYIASCLTKHWNDYNTLMLGRLLGGISTSLLWSAFESWLVSEHLSVCGPPSQAPTAPPSSPFPLRPQADKAVRIVLKTCIETPLSFLFFHLWNSQSPESPGVGSGGLTPSG